MLIFLSLLAGAMAYEASMDHFNLWTYNNQKLYTTELERSLRALVWLDNAKFVEAKNAEDNGVTYKLNQFADLTHEEYLATLSPINDLKMEKVLKEMTLVDLPPWAKSFVPASMDWRSKGVVTPVKNQGMCGSCYSFSTTGALEGACAQKTGKLVSLSEQNIMDCSWNYGNNGCNGGMFDRAFYYIQQNGGIDTEASYPYTEKESYSCKYDASTKGGEVSAFYYVNQGDEDALMTVIGAKGPVAIAINAGQRDFQFYNGGVYDNPACDQSLNHGVLAVGYGTEGGKDYFLVKNSWGTVWGDAGYIKMRRNRGNQCGIATYPSIPDC